MATADPKPGRALGDPLILGLEGTVPDPSTDPVPAGATSDS